MEIGDVVGVVVTRQPCETKGPLGRLTAIGPVAAGRPSEGIPRRPQVARTAARDVD